MRTTARWWTALAAVAMLVSPAAVSAETGGRVFEVETDEAEVAELKKSVAYIMSLSEQEVIDMVPTASGGIYFTDCPNCDHGTQDRGRFTWKPQRPDELVCAACEAVYPGHADYPDDQYLEVKAPEGVHRFHYYERPDGYRLFFRAHADYWARKYLEDQTRNLGELYIATGDDVYARRAAVIMHRFAEVYPGYVHIYDFPFRQKIIQPYDQNRISSVGQYRTSKWSWWAYMDISQPMLRAYDALTGWDGWDEVAPGAQRRVADDLLAGMVEFVLGFQDALHNMSMGMWRDVIYAGRVLDRPAWVHEAIGRFERMLNTRFLHDGHWFETASSYHGQVLKGIRNVMLAANGYSDPASYRHPETGRRFDDLDLSQEVPQYAAALAVFDRVRFPDGRLIPVNDTWAIHTRAHRGTPTNHSESFLMPGLGLGTLAGGEGDTQVMAHLNFTSGIHHKHRDALSLGLFAHGRELLPDIGYTHTRYRRAWANSTMSHNTVVVDGLESQMDRTHTSPELLAYADGGDAFGVIAAESTAAYTQASRYRRTLLKVGQDSRNAYFVDVFEVHGGQQHDYLLHGSADEDSTAAVHGVALYPFDGTLMNPGATFKSPDGESDHPGEGAPYAFVHALERGTLDSEQVTVEMRLDAEPSVGLRSTVLTEPDDVVFLGRAPSLRRAQENNELLDQYTAPTFVLRRSGNELVSRFVVVHEPMPGEAQAAAVSREMRGDVLLVRVDRGAAGRDYVAVGLEGQRTSATFETPDGPLSLEGMYALVRLDGAGRVVSANLVGGQRLSLGDWQIQGQGVWTGEATPATERNERYFDVAESIDDAAAGALIVEFADGTSRAFNVERIAPRGGGSRIYVKESLGLRIDAGKVQLTSYPQREIAGADLRYMLTSIASFGP